MGRIRTVFDLKALIRIGDSNISGIGGHDRKGSQGYLKFPHR
jgi:hypothetical protein